MLWRNTFRMRGWEWRASEDRWFWKWDERCWAASEQRIEVVKIKWMRIRVRFRINIWPVLVLMRFGSMVMTGVVVVRSPTGDSESIPFRYIKVIVWHYLLCISGSSGKIIEMIRYLIWVISPEVYFFVTGCEIFRNDCQSGLGIEFAMLNVMFMEIRWDFVRDGYRICCDVV